MAQQIRKDRLERDKIVNATIAAAFEASKTHFAGIHFESACTHQNFYPTFFAFNSNDGQMPHEMRRKKVPGHAVSCYCQGVSYRKQKHLTKADINALCTKVRGFFETSDTVPNLFDYAAHLRRATDINEVFEALQDNGLVTILMDNTYSNLVGEYSLQNQKEIILADPDSEDGKLILPVSYLVDHIQIAWIW